MQRPHAAAPIVSVIAAGVGVNHLYTNGRHHDSLWPANSRENRQADAIALEAQAGDNMIKMVHQRLAERLQGFIPQQTDQLLVIVATAALSPRRPRQSLKRSAG